MLHIISKEIGKWGVGGGGWWWNFVHESKVFC